MPTIKFIRGLSILGFAICIGGCEKIPGTDAYKIRIAKEVAARELIDPSSAQFRDLKVRDDVVCGEINAKNRMGAYVGFKRFYADVTLKTSSINPEFDIADLLSAKDFCSSVRSSSYSSYSLRTSACNRAMEQELAQISQRLFDSGWARNCEGKPLEQQPPAAATTANVSSDETVTDELNAVTTLTTEEEEWGGPMHSTGESESEGPLVDQNGAELSSTNAARGAPIESELDRIFNSPSSPAKSSSPDDPLQPRSEPPQEGDDR